MASLKKLQSIVLEIREFCESNRDEDRVKKYAKFFTEGWDAYGLTPELLLGQKDKINQKYQKELTLEDYIKLGDLLVKSGKYEEASFAIRLLDPFKDQFQKNHFQEIGAWLEKGICNWGHTDVLCGELLSPFLEKGVAEMDDLAAWRQSPSKWKRRAVPVALLNSAKTTKDIIPILDFIEPMMHDEDRFVHQGLGWLLREAWKIHTKPVEAFLLQHKDTAPRKIYQYATEKMSKEDKERFRAAKKKK